MECDTCCEWMSLWLDDRLTQAQIRQLKAHATACPTCRAALDSLRRVDRLLAAVSMASPAPGFTARFQARLAARRRQHRTWAGFIVLSLAALALLLGVTSLLMIPSLALWENLSTSGLLTKGIGLMLDLGKVCMALFNLAWLILGALTQGLRHPAFIAYTVATAILTVTWTQVVTRRALVRRPATE